jgi:membrane protein involved in colicin uptake
MGKFKPSAPDNSAAIRAQKEQAAKLKAQEEKLAAEEAEREAAAEKKKKAELTARKGRGGGASLLTGLETGVAPEDQKRGSLG